MLALSKVYDGKARKWMDYEFSPISGMIFETGGLSNRNYRISHREQSMLLSIWLLDIVPGAISTKATTMRSGSCNSWVLQRRCKKLLFIYHLFRMAMLRPRTFSRIWGVSRCFIIHSSDCVESGFWRSALLDLLMLSTRIPSCMLRLRENFEEALIAKRISWPDLGFDVCEVMLAGEKKGINAIPFLTSRF